MAEHVHGCLTCRPDMVPAFDKADPRYHDSEKCGRNFRALVNGSEPGYTSGVFEGQDGWVLLACEGFDAAQVHPCPNHPGADPFEHTCLEPRLGRVEVVHGCASDLAARAKRLEEALRPLASKSVFFRALFGKDYE